MSRALEQPRHISDFKDYMEAQQTEIAALTATIKAGEGELLDLAKKFKNQFAGKYNFEQNEEITESVIVAIIIETGLSAIWREQFDKNEALTWDSADLTIKIKDLLNPKINQHLLS